LARNKLEFKLAGAPVDNDMGDAYASAIDLSKSTLPQVLERS
jgi:hypothetical protein